MLWKYLIWTEDVGAKVSILKNINIQIRPQSGVCLNNVIGQLKHPGAGRYNGWTSMVVYTYQDHYWICKPWVGNIINYCDITALFRVFWQQSNVKISNVLASWTVPTNSCQCCMSLLTFWQLSLELEFNFVNISLIHQIVDLHLLNSFFVLYILKRFYINDELSSA